MSNFCGPNKLKAKYFTQVFSLKLFFKLEIKHCLPERRNKDLLPGKSNYVSLHAFRLIDPGQQVSGVPRRGGLECSTPTPIFLSFDKAEPNSQFHGMYICNSLIRVSLICKLSGTPG
jgi:hypothetical protein